MNRRQKIIISVTGIFLVLLILVGLTYAYFLTQIQGNEEDRSITVTTANLVLEYGDGNGILETDKLEPSNDFISFKDSEGNPVESKIFTVTNKGNATIQGYKVYLEKVQNQLVRKDDLVYTLSCKAYTNYGEESQAESGTCSGVTTETIFPDVVTSIVSNDISVGVTHVYELKVKYKEMGVDQSIDMNKIITAKINIYDASTKFLAREIMDNVKSDATVTYNKTTYINPNLQDGETYTMPAEQINNEDERIITYTMDDLGTSYYFRGNVEDNYVNFADMCWRVVRIEGDGSVKLILEDQDQLCDSKDTEGNLNMNGNWNIPVSNQDDANILGNFGYNENLVSSHWIENYLNVDGLATDYENSMATAFQNFQNTFTDKELLKLKSGNWCLNDIAYADSDIDIINTKPLTEEEKEAKYDILEDFYFDSYVRLYGDTKIRPTLKCNGTVMNKFGDNITNMYIGTLTVDEIVYAGGKVETSNYAYYLLNDYQKEKLLNWWTLSPSCFMVMDTYIFSVYADGGLSEEYLYYGSSFRPSINLVSTCEIISGVGTKQQPYVIE